MSLKGVVFSTGEFLELRSSPFARYREGDALTNVNLLQRAISTRFSECLPCLHFLILTSLK